MQSTKRKSRAHPARKRNGNKSDRPHNLSLNSPAFIEKVERLERLMKVAETPRAPPGFTLVKRDDEPGTLQQVGREADNAWAGVKKIMQLLNVEMKSVNISASVSPVYSGSMLANISGSIAQGVGDDQRTGDSLKMKKIRCRYYAYYNTDTAPMTIALVHSKDGLPAAADVFETLASTSYSGFSDQKHDSRKVDVWRWRKTFVLDTYHPRAFFEHDIDLDDLTLYNQGTSTVISGCFSLWAISSTAGANNTIAVQISAQFVDN